MGQCYEGYVINLFKTRIQNGFGDACREFKAFSRFKVFRLLKAVILRRDPQRLSPLSLSLNDSVHGL